MRLTNIERETILNFNEGEEIASLYTYNKKLQNRFDKLAEEFPELIKRVDAEYALHGYSSRSAFVCAWSLLWSVM